MFGIILASHGDLVYGIEDVYTMVFGDLPENIKLISLRKDSDFDTFNEEYNKLLSDFKETKDVSGVIVLTDIEGGTPYNVACSYYYDSEFGMKTEVIAGLNFAMLLETIENSITSKGITDVSENIISVTKDSIIKAEIKEIYYEEDDF